MNSGAILLSSIKNIQAFWHLWLLQNVGLAGMMRICLRSQSNCPWCLMIIKIIETDNDYQKAIALREEVLRKPLGLSFCEQEIANERNHIHFGIFLGDTIIATASLVSEGSSCKMQRVAVRPEYQDEGYGSKLLNFIETEGLNKCFTTIYCHARDTAVPFYKKHGFVAIGEPFLEVGIGHLKMRKLLAFTMQPSSKEEHKEIGDSIDFFNAKNAQCKVLEHEINYTIKSDDKIIAGINSCLYFDEILYVAVLFVVDEYRHQDLGSFLLGKVEDEARSMGAKMVHLDTFDFQASRFYPKYGYEAFGVLDYPKGYKRYYFKKNLLV